MHQLSSQSAWEQFLLYRLEKGRFNWREFEEADEFVEREKYLPTVNNIIAGGGLSIPHKKVINKMGSNKKRIVYTYTPAEMTTLKVLSHLLYKYDAAFAPNCYAFRRGLRAADAVTKVHKEVRDRRMWAYKLDISNYFNSIPIQKLLSKLARLLADDEPLYHFFEEMLSEDRTIYNGEVQHEPRGAMAGVPTASFLANVYLSEVDHYFYEQGVIYARYSDDIILFAEDYDTLLHHKATMLNLLEAHQLKVNPSKEKIFRPDEAYEFLGFKCSGSTIDIAEGAIDKMKGKIRRKMRSVLRWKQRKSIDESRAMERLVKYFNRKFFDDTDDKSLTWSRWYFPIITSAEGLRIIDSYLQQCIRVLSTGRHTKANFRVSYDELKSLGYRSLVHEYYAYREVADDKKSLSK